MKNVNSRYLICLSLLLLAGCAPGLGRTLSVAAIPEQIKVRSTEQPLREVGVVAVSDVRTSDAICVIGGRELPAAGDVEASLRVALERALKTRGYQLQAFSPPIGFDAQLLQWQVTVTPGFPFSEVRAEALVAVAVAPAGKKAVVKGRYSGVAQRTHPFMTESLVEKVLAEALVEAVRQIAIDEQILEATVASSMDR